MLYFMRKRLDSAVINKSVKAISEADTLIIGGTSLIVYPAAGFIDYFRGKHLVVINKGATAREVGAELTIAAPIGGDTGTDKGTVVSAGSTKCQKW